MTLEINIRPEHPGGVIKDWILPEDMSITEAAKKLGVSRQSLDALINERRSLTPEMALKIETVFGGTAGSLLAIQSRYDLYHAEQNLAAITKGLKPYKTHPSLA